MTHTIKIFLESSGELKDEREHIAKIMSFIFIICIIVQDMKAYH